LKSANDNEPAHEDDSIDAETAMGLVSFSRGGANPGNKESGEQTSDKAGCPSDCPVTFREND
jgi:hypothetical protein